ncbi:MAG: MFS transporter, partial [Actinomycetes bacterium]
ARGTRLLDGRFHRAVHAEGADETGLSSLIEMHALSVSGDGLVTVGLAGSLLFGVSAGAARGQVAMYLLFTLAPFAVLGPLVGPLLDRLRGSRRIVLLVTLVVRGLLAFQIAEVVHQSDPVALYPEAFMLLLASKAYIVTRSAILPRLLPPSMNLVRANSRMALLALIAATALTPIGAGLAKTAGAEWTLRMAGVVYLVGSALTLFLPGELDVDVESAPTSRTSARPPGRRLRLLPQRALGDIAGHAVWAAGGGRWLGGFVTVYLALLVRHARPGGLPGGATTLVLVAAGAGAGALAGNAMGTRLSGRAPQALQVGALLTAVGALLATILVLSPVTLVVLGVATGATQALTKLAADSLLQSHIPYEVRSAAFARSESTLQLCWAVGGAVGVAPLAPRLALAVAVVVMGVALVDAVLSARRHRRSPPLHRPSRPAPMTS